MMTSVTESILLTVATHPYQVALGGVMLFYAFCEALAAFPLKPRRRSRGTRVRTLGVKETRKAA